MKKILAFTLAIIMIITFALAVSDALFGTAFANYIGIEISHKENKTITPEEIDYTINFAYRETNDPELETLVYTIKLKKNAVIPFEDYYLDIPGYIFKGWHTAGAGAWDLISENEIATADITYYAVYEEIPLSLNEIGFYYRDHNYNLKKLRFAIDNYEYINSDIIMTQALNGGVLEEYVDGNGIEWELYSITLRVFVDPPFNNHTKDVEIIRPIGGKNYSMLLNYIKK